MEDIRDELKWARGYLRNTPEGLPGAWAASLTRRLTPTIELLHRADAEIERLRRELAVQGDQVRAAADRELRNLKEIEQLAAGGALTREEVLEGLRSVLRLNENAFPGLAVSTVSILDRAIAYLETQLDDFRPIEELSSITREQFAIEFKLRSGETYIHTHGSAWFRGGRFDHESMADCGIRWFRLRGDITEEFPAGRPLEVIPKEGRA